MSTIKELTKKNKALKDKLKELSDINKLLEESVKSLKSSSATDPKYPGVSILNKDDGLRIVELGFDPDSGNAKVIRESDPIDNIQLAQYRLNEFVAENIVLKITRGEL